jgi:hypothetical protein
MKPYRFDKKRHRHELLVDGKWRSLTGCTTVLGVLNKPKLLQWAVDVAIGCLGWTKAEEWQEEGGKYKKVKVPEKLRVKEITKGIESISKLSPMEFLTFLDEARVAYITTRKESAKYGKYVHEEIEKIIREAISSNNGYVQEQTHKEKSIQNFIDWAIQKKAKFLDVERNIYSEKLFIAGIVDIVCEIDGQIWLMDIKTSGSGIYPENFAQMAGYEIMLNAMDLYQNITGYIVLNLKENGEMLEKRSVSNENNQKFFLACLSIYREQERIKKTTLN